MSLFDTGQSRPQPGVVEPDEPSGSPMGGVGGMLGSLRGAVDGVLATMQDRFELMAIEIQEEKARFVRMLVWTSVFACAALLGLLFGSCVLVVAVWDTPARLPVIGALALVYAAGAAFAGLRLRRALKTAPRPFAATIAELQTDRRCLQPKT